MSISKLALASAAAACALNTTTALAQDEPASPTTAPIVAPPPAKPKRAARPKPPAAPVAVPVAAPEAPVPNQDASRLQSVEAALREQGILPPLPPSPTERQKLLKDQLAQLAGQRRNLEAAIEGGLNADSVAPALADLRRKEAELSARLAAQDAQPAPSEAVKSPLTLRLEALEASLAQVERARGASEPGKPALAPTAQAPSPLPAPGPTPSVGRAGWQDGFLIESADANYALRICGLFDLKFSYQGLERETDEFALSAPFARLGLKGNLFSKSFKYLFVTELGKGFAQLQYYWGDYTFVPDYFAVRAGQQQRPFSRLFLVPAGKGQFISANPTLKAFGDATDLGIVLHNGQPRFEYAVGFFNGTTSKSVFSGKAVVDPATGTGSVQNGTFSNVPKRFQPAFTARVGFNHGGIEGYTESDLEGGGFRAAVGAAGYLALDLDDDQASNLRGTLDGLIKYRGFSTHGALYIASKQAGSHFADRAREATGLSVQAGYVVAGRVEPVMRYALVSPKGPQNDTQDLTGGINVFFFKHALKWQTDAGVRVVRDGAVTTKSSLYESQLQFSF